VDAVGHAQWNERIAWLDNDLHEGSVLAGLDLALLADNAWVTLSPAIMRCVQFVEVAYRPIKLETVGGIAHAALV
jgi:hypothetical protein